MNQNITVEKFNSSTTIVALIGEDGTGPTKKIQDLVDDNVRINQNLSRVTANKAASESLLAQVIALGFTLPETTVRDIPNL